MIDIGQTDAWPPWKAEPELEIPPPRRAQFKGGRLSSILRLAPVIAVTGGFCLLGWFGLWIWREDPLPGATWFLTSVAALFFLYRRRQQVPLKKLLVETGIPTCGRVVKKKNVGESAYQFTVEYLGGGRLLKVVSESAEDDLLVGEVATVLYLPTEPEKAVVYLLSAYEAAWTAPVKPVLNI